MQFVYSSCLYYVKFRQQLGSLNVSLSALITSSCIHIAWSQLTSLVSRITLFQIPWKLVTGILSFTITQFTCSGLMQLAMNTAIPALQYRSVRRRQGGGGRESMIWRGVGDSGNGRVFKFVLPPPLAEAILNLFSELLSCQTNNFLIDFLSNTPSTCTVSFDFSHLSRLQLFLVTVITLSTFILSISF